MAEIDIPTDFTKVSESWLLQVLKASGRADVSSLTLLDVQDGFATGVGILSSMARIKVELTIGENDCPVEESYVMKLLPKDGKMRDLVLEGGMDIAEIEAYKSLLRNMVELEGKYGCTYLQDTIPKFIYGEYYRDPVAQSVLVLEDLKVTGYSNVDYVEGLDLAHSIESARFLGNFHATGYALQTELGQEPTVAYPFIYSAAFADHLVTRLVDLGLEQIIDICQSFPDSCTLVDNVRKACDKGMSRIHPVMDKGGDFQLTVIHVDFWNNNLMFKEAENGESPLIKVVDWQLLAYGPAFVPFAVFFLTSTSKECQEKHLDEVVEAYWKAFVTKCDVLRHKVPGTLQKFKNELENDGWLQAFMWCIESVDFFILQDEYKKKLRDIIVWLHKRGVL